MLLLQKMVHMGVQIGRRWSPSTPRLIRSSNNRIPPLPARSISILAINARMTLSLGCSRCNPLTVQRLIGGRNAAPRLPLTIRCSAAHSFSAADIETEVGILVEGNPTAASEQEIDALLPQLYTDAKAALQQAAMFHTQDEARDIPPGPLELSLVLCDDSHIRELNKEWRGKDAPTDVLSFEMGEIDEEYNVDDDEEWDGEELAVLDSEDLVDDLESDESDDVVVVEDDNDDRAPATLLGDVVISLDTATKQAAERGHSLHDEIRILLVHGILHLLGYDHEDDEMGEKEMAAAEVAIVKALGWKGDGLITATNGDYHPGAAPSTTTTTRQRSSDIRLLALDMDGTLLDSTSRILPSSIEAIRAAMDRGVTVMLATGKARPAAVAAMNKVQLAGPGLVVHSKGPGIFLQGLAVHSMQGEMLQSGVLSDDVVRAAFTFAQETGVSLVGFLGETCVTNRMTEDVELLHTKYYEPLAEVAPSIDAALQGAPWRKLLFMAPPDVVSTELKPYWNSILEKTTAQTMQAVPDMLEVTPRGVNKFVGMEALLSHEGLPVDAVMAVGDGMNDFELVAGVGVGVAMGNAVPEVKRVADCVVASNDADGVAEAIARFIL